MTPSNTRQRADSLDITDLQSHQVEDIQLELTAGSASAVDARPHIGSLTSRGRPIKVTAYRLMVSVAIFGFGLAKYLLTGEGKAVDANVLDFVVAVPMALLCVESQPRVK